MAEKDWTRRGFLASAGQGLLAASVAGAIPLAPPDNQPPNLNPPGPPSKKVGYCIVGLGQLALHQILPAFATAEHSRPVALVSGHAEKARMTAEHYGIDPKSIYSYEDYDRIRDNSEIEIVYIVLPNHMHAEYTIRAAKAGKHVLCEKPMCVQYAEGVQMIDACKSAGNKLMIAYRLRYEPFNQKTIEIARSNQFGSIKSISAQNLQNTQAPNIRLSKSTGGGPLGDVGIYCLNATRYLTGEEPSEFTAMREQPKDDPRFAEVAARYVWTQRFPSGAVAHCACGFDSSSSSHYRVVCEKGWFELENAFPYSGQRLRMRDEKGITEIMLPRVDHFAKEMDHFSQCVLEDKNALTPGEEGLADMKAIAFIEAAAKSGTTAKVSDDVPQIA